MNRIIELALEALNAQKEKIDLEIRSLSKGVNAAVSSLKKPAKKKTLAERKAQSQRMKAYWKKKKAAK